MKTFKRAIAMVLALVMVLTMAPAALAVEGLTIDIADGALAKGETVILPVTISGHDNDLPIASAKLAVEYDHENLTLVKATGRYRELVSSSREQGLMLITANGDGISWADAYGLYAEDGDTLFWLAFTTKDEVANGSYEISFKAHNSDSMFSNSDREQISDSSVTIDVGTITVTGGVDKLTNSNTTIEGLNATYTYNDGNPVEPSFTVKYNGTTLNKGTDYDVSFENNVNVGTATVTVTGKGAYKGSVTKTFEIVKKAGQITGTEVYTKVYGDSFTLDAVANSGAALSYTSSNTSVATVDASGKVTAVGAGSAVITVSASETEFYTKPANFQVNVTVGKASQTLTGAASHTKTYGDASFNLNISGAQGNVTYKSSNTSVATVDASGNVTIVGVGTANIEVKAAEVSGKYNGAVKTVTVKVNKKAVTVSGITADDKEYDKTTNATIRTGRAVINGMVPGDDLSVSATGSFANANAGDNKTVNLTVSLTGSDAANYTLSADSQKTTTATIDKAAVAVPVAKTGLVYNTASQTGVVAGADYTVTGGSATNAGNYTATATLKDAANYMWDDLSFDGQIFWSIAKANASDLTMNLSHRYNNTETHTITASEVAQKLNAPGTVTFGTWNVSGSVLGTTSCDASTITYALAGGLTSANAGETAAITVVVSSQNYNNVTLTVNIAVQDKVDVSDEIVFANGEATYNGKVQKYETAKRNGSASNITYIYSDSPVNVGTYTVTAVYEDADNFGKKSASFIIKPATVSVSGATVETKEYDGNTNAVVSAVRFNGLVNGETFTAADYTVTSAAFANANAGTGKQVTYDVELATAGTAANYVLIGTIPAATGTITAKPVDVIVAPVADQTFNGNAIKPAVIVSATGTLGGYELANGVDYTVSYENNTNAGTAKAVVTAKSGSNYTFAAVEADFQILKAVAESIADLTADYTYNYSGVESVVIEGVPSNAGTVAYAIGTLAGEASMVSNVSVSASGKVTFTVNAVDISLVNETVTIPVIVKMQNYEDLVVNVVITRSEKDVPVLSARSIEKVYDGVKLTAADIKGTATFEGQVLTGTWSWVTDPATMVNANESGYNAIAKFTPDDDDFAEAEIVITVVIHKATPVGVPSYTRIKEAGKTLADANLGVGSIQPSGTIAWVLPETTEVESGVAYDWIFTPDDTTNYKSITGKQVVYEEENNSIYLPIFGALVGGAAGDVDSFGSIVERFYDVSSGDWFADAVTMVVAEGLFEGVSYNYFEPNGTMTRAMLVTVLWRLAGQPVPYAGSSFTDVVYNDWYTDAVAWAELNGIITGVTETTFAPNQSITREQLAVILHRYAKYMGFSGTQSADLAVYTDAAKVSEYAVDAMSWAVAKGLISGMTETTLAPNGTATRAQVATILMRFVDNVL